MSRNDVILLLGGSVQSQCEIHHAALQDTVTIKKKRKEKEINGGSEWNLPSPLLLLIIRSPKYE